MSTSTPPASSQTTVDLARRVAFHRAALLATLGLAVAPAVALAEFTPASGNAPAVALDEVGTVASTHVLVRLRPGAAVSTAPDGRPIVLAPDGARHPALEAELARVHAHAIERPSSVRPANVSRAARLGMDRWWAIRVPTGTDTPALAAALRSFAALFEVVECDGIGGIAELVPNDPSFGLQYALKNIGQVVVGQNGVVGADVDAGSAWDTTTGDGQVVIAFLDSGVSAHPELAGRILPGFNVPLQSQDTTDVCSSHGTHVAGIAAATGGNAAGIAGVCWNALLLPVVVVNPCTGTESWVADGITWAVDNGADIINMSLQYSSGTTYLHDAVQYAQAAGVVMFAATGNSNAAVSYPAKWAETIAVAATDNKDKRWTSSNFGPQVDVAAPGWQVYSLNGVAGYGYKSGTSMAVPHLSGLAALLRAVQPGITDTEIRAAIESTVDDVEAPGFDNLTGFGRVNAAAAIAAVASPPAPGDLNLDGVVDSADLGLMLSAWGMCADCDAIPCPADLDGSCAVDGADVGTLLANWSA